MGANGWRMSHNPPNPILLDYTDKYENRNFGNMSVWFQDQSDMILRDRNQWADINSHFGVNDIA